MQPMTTRTKRREVERTHRPWTCTKARCVLCGKAGRERPPASAVALRVYRALFGGRASVAFGLYGTKDEIIERIQRAIGEPKPPAELDPCRNADCDYGLPHAHVTKLLPVRDIALLKVPAPTRRRGRT